MQRLVNNNRGIVFSALPVPMAANATMEYLMPTLINNCNVTEERRFLRDPCRDLISRTVSDMPLLVRYIGEGEVRQKM
jgi:hypothetical protein